jgi:hypothetical protein
MIRTWLDPLIVPRSHPHPTDGHFTFQDETLLRAVVGMGRIGGTRLQSNQTGKLPTVAIQVQHPEPNSGSRPAHEFAVLRESEDDAGELGRSRPVGGPGGTHGGE